MKRRDFILALRGAAVAWPLAARAEQTAKVARIGFMVTGSLASPEQRAVTDSFLQGLHERGYAERQNIVIEYRYADGKIERFAELAKELVRLNVDVIVASNTPAAALQSKRRPLSPSWCLSWVTRSEMGSWPASLSQAGTLPE